MEIKGLLNNIKGLFSKEYDKKFVIFATVFLLSILLKLVCFTNTINGSLTFPSGIEDSAFQNFLLGYSIYLGIALLVVALGTFSKYFWPAFALDIILDVWIFANLLSLRSHGIMITGYDFRLVSNMNGFWDSLFAFIHFSDLLLFISTGAFIYVYIKFLKPYTRRYLIASCILVVAIFLTLLKPMKFNTWWGLPVNIFQQLNISGDGRKAFATDYSIFSNFFAELYFCNSLDNIPTQKDLEYEEEKAIKEFMITPGGQDTLQDNLIIIFVESMEGWTLNKSINGQEITPYFNALSKRNALYGYNMKAQTQRGSSSDAQLAVNTGLLPLVYEAVCFGYPNNYYYSIGDAMMKYGSHNTMLIPTNASAWNQAYISKPWGFPTLYSQEYSDEELFNDLAATFDSIQEPFCLEAVTMASHAPFWKYASFSELTIPEGLPIFKENYIKALNYTDKCFGNFIEKVKDNPKFAKTTIVIVGDHAIFGSNRNEFDDSEIGRSLEASKNDFVPFVISSPNHISASKEISDTTYHMDIYPTLINLFKLDNYPWRGFGCDMAKGNFTRKYDENQLSTISGNIIKNDYFNNNKK